jgi:hypothetical protein
VSNLADWFQITNAAAMKKAGRSPLFGQTEKVESALNYRRNIAFRRTHKQLTRTTDFLPATSKPSRKTTGDPDS